MDQQVSNVSRPGSVGTNVGSAVGHGMGSSMGGAEGSASPPAGYRSAAAGDPGEAGRRATRGTEAGARTEARLREVADEARAIGRKVETSFFAHPYSTVGAVAAASFFAGSLLGSRVAQLVLAAGVGYATARVFPEPSAIGKKILGA